MKKQTEFLPDLPVSVDAFGMHQSIADEISSIVTSENINRTSKPHSIALLGDWGSGKSSVVSMLRDSLAGSGQARVFVYDAWSHEGDGLRRAFLDALSAELADVMTEAEAKDVRREIWDHHEVTTTTTEPTLRPHGRAILLALIFTPLGIGLFGRYPDAWYSAFGWLWSLCAILLAAAPLIVLIYYILLRALGDETKNIARFGVESADELRDLKLSSVLLNKTTGTIDKKKVTNPQDSITQFRMAFRKLCGHACADGKQLVVVVDNIDRLGRAEARQFWATMQSFFDRTGWRETAVMSKVWLLAPFSLQAVNQVFMQTNESAAADARSFVNKTFDLSFNVPPPILVDLRSYMFAQLRLGFPSHDRVALENVRDLFDRDRGEGRPVGSAGDVAITRKTPREIKLFINQLVALYRTQSEDLALETLATYLLRREAIDTDGLFQEGLLSAYQLALLPREPEVVQQLAAVHFGVSTRLAAQVVLAVPLRAALEQRDDQALEALSKRSGFSDVLEAVAAQAENRVSDPLAMAAAISSLSTAEAPELGAFWLRLKRKVEDSFSLGTINDDTLTGLRVLVSRLSETDRAEFLSKCVEGLSHGWQPGGVAASTSDDQWTRFAEAVVALQGSAEAGRISIPGTPAIVVSVIEQAARLNGGASLARRLQLPSPPLDLAAAVVSWPIPGYGPANAGAFYRIASSIGGLSINWQAVTTLVSARLAEGKDPDTIRSDIDMLLALASAGVRPASTALKRIIDDGQLAVRLSPVADQPQAIGAALAAIILFSPDLTPQALSKKGRADDKVLIDLLTEGGVSDAVVSCAANSVVQAGYQDWVLYCVAPRPQLHTCGTDILREIIDRGVKFYPTRERLLPVVKYMSGVLGESYAREYFENLSDRQQLLADIQRKKIDIPSSYLEFMTLSAAFNWSQGSLKSRLAKYLRSRSPADWQATLLGTEPTLLQIALHMHQHFPVIEVGGEGFAGISGSLVQAGSGQPIESGTAGRINGLVGLLDRQSRRELPSAVWRTVNGLTSASGVNVVIELVGDLLLEKNGSSLGDASKGAVRLLLQQPSLSAALWFLRWVEMSRNTLQKDPVISRDLRQRINAAVAPASSLSNRIKTELRRARSHLPRPRRSAKAGAKAARKSVA